MAFAFSDLSPEAQVQAIYVAYYGRGADPEGRAYWADQLESANGDLTAIIDAFGTSPEALERFGTLGNEAAVRALFQSLFGRTPDSAGLDFYIGELEAGRLSLETIALDVLNGAQNTDAAIIENRITAGQAYTDALAATSTEAKAADARAVVAGVDETPASVTAAQAAAEAITGQRDGASVSGDVQQAGSPITEVPSAPTDLDVGVGGAGLLAVTGGQEVTVASEKYDILRAGVEPQGRGIVIIHGDGSTLTTTGSETDTITQVGPAGDGVMLVSDGGQMTTEELSLGRNGGRGEMLVQGSGTEVAVDATGEPGYRGKVYIGDTDGGYGAMTVSAGASLLAQDLEMGIDPGSTGQLTVTGTSTLLDLGPGEAEIADPASGPFLEVARYGEARLDIRDGGQVRIESEVDEAGFQVGRREGAEGHVVVDGAGSRLSVEGPGELGNGAGTGIVGRSGDGTLTVSDGGTVIIDDDGGLAVGFAATATGSVEVSGEGSVLDAGRGLLISAGFGGDGMSLPENVVYTGFGIGTVTVADGGTLRAGAEANDGVDDIFIGAGGTLNVQEGGTLIGDVRNEGGVFEPGNSPGLAVIEGDFATGGELRMEIEGRTAGAHDRVDVSGVADLAGTMVLDFSEADTLKPGDTVTILTADDGLTTHDLTINTVGLPGDLTAELVATSSGMSVSIDAA